ncbi:hypothetical protein PVK06_020338 [Gossypium arboreum]|uniref:HAT C-terminal dimerisation domain-containing protein n=1 Tax=Gossypium arboreum TaxID=29729 RepID=A0ABR0PM42_GOSAR|nr:hypothetical protein PVK06_020338 [Gossypium arboreum]
MTKLKCENKDELKAQCNHCKSIFSTKSSSRTSHLRRCLNSCLKKINKDITQYTIATQPSLGGGSSIKTYKFDADKCHRVVSTFLVCGKQSFKTVEELRFRYMMSVDSPNFKNISRQTTTMDFLKCYAQERDHVKEELAKAPGLICLTFDNWNSKHTNDEYICIITQWVDKDRKLQKKIIKFRALSPLYDVKAGLELVDDVVDFFQIFLNNLKLLFDEYVKNSKSPSSSLARSSNVSDNNPVNSSLYQFNVNRFDLGGDYDESDDYKQYLCESNTKSKRSQLDIYLEEPGLKLNSQIDVLDYWSKSSIQYHKLSFLARKLLAIPISTVASKLAFSMRKKVITSLRSFLKLKMVQAIVFFDDWMRAKGFSTASYYSRFSVIIL